MSLINAQGGDLAVAVGGVYRYVDPSSAEDFDRKRQRLDQATGNRNNTVDWHDGASEVKCNVKKALSDADGVALFGIMGLGATIGAPTLTTIIYADPNRTVTCANQLCNDVELTGEQGKVWELNSNYLGTSIPAVTAGYQLVRPTFETQPNYLYWRDLATFTSVTASTLGITKFNVKVNHNLDPFPGIRTDGYTVPTVYTPGQIEVTFGFTMQMLGSGDYSNFLAACDTVADLGFTGTPFCVVAGKVLTVTIKSGLYETVKPERSLKKTTMEAFTGASKALGGANQAVITFA